MNSAFEVSQFCPKQTLFKSKMLRHIGGGYFSPDRLLDERRPSPFLFLRCKHPVDGINVILSSIEDLGQEHGRDFSRLIRRRWNPRRQTRPIEPTPLQSIEGVKFSESSKRKRRI